MGNSGQGRGGNGFYGRAGFGGGQSQIVRVTVLGGEKIFSQKKIGALSPRKEEIKWVWRLIHSNTNQRRCK